MFARKCVCVIPHACNKIQRWTNQNWRKQKLNKIDMLYQIHRKYKYSKILLEKIKLQYKMIKIERWNEKRKDYDDVSYGQRECIFQSSVNFYMLYLYRFLNLYTHKNVLYNNRSVVNMLTKPTTQPILDRSRTNAKHTHIYINAIKK